MGEPGNKVVRTIVGENSEKNGLVFSQNIMLSHIKSYARESVIYDKNIQKSSCVVKHNGMLC